MSDIPISSPVRVRTRPVGSAPLANVPSRRAQAEVWPIDRIRLPDRSPRRRGRRQAEAIAGSVGRLGFNLPVVVTPEGELIDGAGRLEAALALGYNEVPVAIVSGLQPEEIKALRLSLNRLGEKVSGMKLSWPST